MVTPNLLVPFATNNRDSFRTLCSFLHEMDVCQLSAVCKTFRDFTQSVELWNQIGKKYGLQVSDTENPRRAIVIHIRTINDRVGQLFVKKVEAKDPFTRYTTHISVVMMNLKAWTPHITQALMFGIMRDFPLSLFEKDPAKRPTTPSEFERVRDYEMLERVRFLLLAGVQPENNMKTLSQYVALRAGKNVQKTSAAYSVEMHILRLVTKKLGAKMTPETRQSPETQAIIDRMIYDLAKTRQREDIVTVLIEEGFHPSEQKKEAVYDVTFGGMKRQRTD